MAGSGRSSTVGSVLVRYRFLTDMMYFLGENHVSVFSEVMTTMCFAYTVSNIIHALSMEYRCHILVPMLCGMDPRNKHHLCS